ncbi:MAG TPA: reverse transcriptase-like protein [Candidatus Saccharimonadales bacterium]|nr:reverse transcriptase-like protein [Candidatus Saccharimonadales bacterium]
MKAFRFRHELAQKVLAGQKTASIRINDEKNLGVNDEIEIIDKVMRKDPSSWQVIGLAKVNEIIAKRLGDITEADLIGHEGYSSKEDMMKTLSSYHGPRINSDTTVKIVRFTFKPVKPYSVPYGAETFKPINDKVKLYADGGSRGNPGPSASGFVLMDVNGTIINEGGIYLGITTNNQAEYNALKIGLEEAAKRHAKQVDVYMDSQLVVKQMTGAYKVRHTDIVPVHREITEFLKNFEKVTFTHVPRELNKLADAMVNEVLDAEPIDSR